MSWDQSRWLTIPTDGEREQLEGKPQAIPLVFQPIRAVTLFAECPTAYRKSTVRLPVSQLHHRLGSI